MVLPSLLARACLMGQVRKSKDFHNRFFFFQVTEIPHDLERLHFQRLIVRELVFINDRTGAKNTECTAPTPIEYESL